jgi:hypothetical protein
MPNTWWMMRRRRLLVGLGTVLGALALQAVLSAQISSPPIGTDDAWGAWFRQNVLGLALLAFHMGVSWREFLDHRRELERHNVKLQDVDKRFEQLDEKYAQNRVIDQVHEELLRRFDRLERRLDGRPA